MYDYRTVRTLLKIEFLFTETKPELNRTERTQLRVVKIYVTYMIYDVNKSLDNFVFCADIVNG